MSPSGMKRMHFTCVNGINLAYYVSGHGEPALMIQGLGGRAADWGDVPARLAPHFEVITFDNRGTGKSDTPDTEYHLDVMADEAVAVLRAAAPTLVIHGDADPLVPYANATILAERIPGAQMAALRGCGHLAMWEQPAELVRLLLDFLD